MTRYLFSFGIQGIEALINLDDYREQDKDAMIEKLSSDDPKKVTAPSSQLIAILSMRFRLNSHREIRSFLFDSELTEDELAAAYKRAPKKFIKNLKMVGKELRI